MIILVIGVSGSGKTLIGQKLAASLKWEFQDADDFHPASNIEKMSRGIPLNDQDRAPWLEALQQAIACWLAEGKNVVLACSALKSSYRRQLCQDYKQVQLVYLRGSFKLLKQRLTERQNHFMKEEMLNSQLQDLEAPTAGIHIDIAQDPAAIVDQIRFHLGL